MTAPDPGEGWRLVTDYSEAPHPEAQHWFFNKTWIRREAPKMQYKESCYYRVPDPVPEPVPLRWPDIPVSDDAWFQQPEPDSGADVAAWVLSAVMAVVLLLTGFILGWSWGG